MTSPDDPMPTPQPEDPGKPAQPQYADRSYRSMAGLVSGVLLLALTLWLGGDAVLNGTGRTPWLALAALLLIIPLVTAFTLRPAVFAGADRIRVRNPFRTISAPWAAVESMRSGYSTELFADGKRYQVWAIPVSLRARKRAARQAARAGGLPAGTSGRPSMAPDETARSWSDQAVADLRELAERNAERPEAQGEVSVRWAYEVIAPAAAGAVVLAVLLGIG